MINSAPAGPKAAKMPNHNVDKYFLASIVESSNDSIITTNLDMEITSWNKAAEDLYGYTADEAIGKQLTSLTLTKDFGKLLEKIKKLKLSKEVEEFESELVGKDKRHLILEVVVSPVKNDLGDLVGVSTIARDLTARRVAEKAQTDRDVLQRLIIAQEDERSRISRDLHDELGQQLTGLRFALERTKAASASDRRAIDLSEIETIAASIDKSVDFLAWELRPALLEGVGLAAAINDYVAQWSEHAGIRAEVLCTLKRKRLSARVETNLYRIMQEALNNTHKHARATSVDIILEKRNDAVCMIITDDGRGFNPRNKRHLSKGLGLTGMRERAALLGGTLEIESSRKHGTAIHVRIPDLNLNKRKAHQAETDTGWHTTPDKTIR
jgi:PAS domain S-box-containing protein